MPIKRRQDIADLRDAIRGGTTADLMDLADRCDTVEEALRQWVGVLTARLAQREERIEHLEAELRTRGDGDLTQAIRERVDANAIAEAVADAILRKADR